MSYQLITRSQYNAILAFIDRCAPRQALKKLKVSFSHIDEMTLWSIDNTHYRNKMKKNTVLLKSDHKFLKQVYQPYIDKAAVDDAALLKIADLVNISPALVAKRLLEHLLLHTELGNILTAPENDEISGNAAHHSIADLTSTCQSTDLPIAHQSTDLPTTQRYTDPPSAHQHTDLSTAHPSTDLPTTHQYTDSPNSALKPAMFSPTNEFTPHRTGLSQIEEMSDTQTVGSEIPADLRNSRSALPTGLSSLLLLTEFAIKEKLQLKWTLSKVKNEGGCLVHTAEVVVGDSLVSFKATGPTQCWARLLAAEKVLKILQDDKGMGDGVPSLNKTVSPSIRTEALKRFGEEVKTDSKGSASQKRLGSKKIVSMWLKEPHLIPDNKLSRQVQMCVVNDSQYGPIAMALHTNIGSEYERKLIEQVKSHHLHYEDEKILRKRGYDKTPDVKLSVPIAIDGKVINWIESKASFGDEVSHQRYLNDQLWSYWNRFGAGLVIYWFGYVSEITVSTNEGILVSHEFPDTFVTMDCMNET